MNSFSGITGFAIVEEVSKNFSSVFGLAFVLIGALLLMARRVSLEERTGSGLTVTATDRFVRSVKGHDIKKINKAIQKIGIGKGNEERLKADRDEYSIRVGGGDRIVYHKQEGNAVVLDAYLPAHEYDRFLARRS
jgi:Txe/YoeB family toxin of Txe-Axe toxin-antitoxin module